MIVVINDLRLSYEMRVWRQDGTGQTVIWGIYHLQVLRHHQTLERWRYYRWFGERVGFHKMRSNLTTKNPKHWKIPQKNRNENSFKPPTYGPSPLTLLKVFPIPLSVSSLLSFSGICGLAWRPSVSPLSLACLGCWNSYGDPRLINTGPSDAGCFSCSFCLW